MADVRKIIVVASTRFGKLRHIWNDNELHQHLRMRLYKVCICSIVTYGSKTWTITTKVAAPLNGVNVRMVSIITGNTPHEETSTSTKTFHLGSTID